MEWRIEMRGQALLAAGLMAMTFAVAAPASAQTYQSAPYGYAQDPNCSSRKTTNGVVGALVGGALGAVLGHNVYARGHKDDARIVGGLGGAAVGAAIGAGGTRCNTGAAYGGYDNNGYADNGYAPPPAAAPPPAPPPSYGYNDRRDDELLGGPDGRYAPAPPPRVYAQNRGYSRACRVVDEMRRDRWGRPYRVPVQVCRDPYSGDWVVTR
jgi:hypothetical protein